MTPEQNQAKPGPIPQPAPQPEQASQQPSPVQPGLPISAEASDLVVEAPDLVDLFADDELSSYETRG